MKMQAPPDTGRQSPAPNCGTAITCFTPDTAITTLNGKKNVWRLAAGDRVLTRDRGFQPVLWIGQRHLRAQDVAEQAPVLIRAGSLGPGMPDRDMVISPHHRVLTTDRAALAQLGETEALIEAAALIGRPGISRVAPRRLTYIHVLLDQHEVIHSDNIWSESFHLSSATARALLNEHPFRDKPACSRIADAAGATPHALARACLTAQDWHALCA